MSESIANPASVPVDFSKALDTSTVKGKNAIVTGSATGIGEGIARALAEAGAYVTVADINEEVGGKVAADLSAKGLKAQFVRTDTTSWQSQLQLFDQAAAFSPSNGAIDIVVPCAGVATRGLDPWLEDPPKDESGNLLPPTIAAINVNLIGVLYTTHLSLHHFKKNPGDSSSTASKQIIYIASLAGYSPPPNSASYSASKFGVRGLWKSIRSNTTILGEGKPLVRQNLIAPTYVVTPMTEGLKPILDQRGLTMAEVADVVEGVMRLASDESIYGRALAIGPNRLVFDIEDDFELSEERPLGKNLMAGGFGPGLQSWLKN